MVKLLLNLQKALKSAKKGKKEREKITNKCKTSAKKCQKGGYFIVSVLLSAHIKRFSARFSWSKLQYNISIIIKYILFYWLFLYTTSHLTGAHWKRAQYAQLFQYISFFSAGFTWSWLGRLFIALDSFAERVLQA